MQLKTIFPAALCAAILGLGLDLGQAQTANYAGPASGGEWNTAANWDVLVPPGVGTNAVIGAGTNVDYNLPMAATSFGAFTLNGILNVNAAGFNSGAVTMLSPASQKLFINNGGAVVVSGNMSLGTNANVTLAAGGSLAVNGTLTLASGESSKAPASFSTFTNNGGTLTVNATTINPGTGTGNGLLVINGGINNLGNTIVGRSAAGANGQTLGLDGVVVYGGQVVTTNLNIGNSGNAPSAVATYVAGGVVTNFGNVTISELTSARLSRFVQTGGLFVNPDPGIVYPNGTVSGTISIYAVLGGTNIVGGFFLGNSNLSATTIKFTNSGTLYVGSQGIASNGAVLVTAVLNGGSLMGATAPWTSSLASMKLNGGMSTIQTADMDGNPNDITLQGGFTGTGGLNVTGGGILTIGAANTYAGNTFINDGTLVLGAGGSMTSPEILIGSGTTYDVSQASGYTVNAGQTLAGLGTVIGAVTAVGSSIVYPGSNSIAGTLTFQDALTENGGVINQFNLSSNPAGPGNDFINAAGGLNLTGINTVAIVGTLTSGSPYPLINYGGSLTGDISNLAVSGPSGIFSNSVLDHTIYFIAQTSVRGPTNIVWLGNSIVNDWDTETTTNWLNTGTAALDFFVPGDTAVFNDLGATNSLVNIPGIVSPGAIIVNTTSNYMFAGNGAIAGIGSLTVSNGILNLLTTNTYTGPTILAGGVLLTSNLMNGGQPSSIGAATSDSGNVILNGGTLAYNGASAGTDRGMTLTNGGGIFDVISGTTLTLNGTLTGNGVLTLVDSGTLTIASPNNYSGGTTLSNGTLGVNDALALGTGPVNLNSGIMAIGAVKPANTIVANGGSIRGGNTGGLTGIGKVIGSSALVISVTTSNGTFDLDGDMTAYSGTLILSNGNTGASFVRFNGTTGSALATWDLGTGPMDLNVRTSSTTNTLGALKGGTNTTLSGRGGSSNNGGSTWFIGGENLSTTYDGVIQNGSGGSASTTAINKIGTGTLSLSGQNTYSGTTTVSTGILALINNGTTDGSIASSATINVVPGAILDVSGLSDDTLHLGNSANQALEGRGNLNGFLNTGGQGVVAPGGGPGGSTGVLTVNNAVTLGGTAWMKVNRTNSLSSDELVSLSTIAYGGTLVVTNIGPPLQVGDTFTLFHGTSMSGSFSLVLPPFTAWDTSQLAAHGTITLTQIFKPVISSANFSGLNVDGTITLNITNGPPLGNINILTSTNLALPFSSWVTNTTTGFDNDGNLFNFSFQVDNTQPQQFIILQGF